jgi:ribonuclease HI
MQAILYTDGGSRGNPGPAGAGVVLLDAQGQVPLHEAGYFLGAMTNNAAEYRGLIRGLGVAAELGVTHLDVRCDSELMVQQINGKYKVKSEKLRPLFERAVRLLGGFEK